MNNFSLKGVADWFYLGKKGPRVKKDGDKIAFRNHDDSAFINIQAKDPVDPQDMVTLQYLQDNASNLPFNVDNTLFSNIAYTDLVKQIGVIDIPQNALVYQIQVEVTQAWDDVNATLDVGTSVLNDRLMSELQVNLSQVGIYVIETSDIFSASATINAYLSNGTSTQGQAEVTVLYTLASESAILPIGAVYITWSNYPVSTIGENFDNYINNGDRSPIKLSGFGDFSFYYELTKSSIQSGWRIGISLANDSSQSYGDGGIYLNASDFNYLYYSGDGLLQQFGLALPLASVAENFIFKVERISGVMKFYIDAVEVFSVSDSGEWYARVKTGTNNYGCDSSYYVV